MRLMIITATLLLNLFIGGCNTMQGMGKDIKTGGKNLEHAAEKHKD